MDEKDAGMYAEDYMIKSFQRANPVLIEQITKQVYGEGKEYQDLTPKEREMVDNEYQSYYQIYKSGEVR